MMQGLGVDQIIEIDLTKKAMSIQNGQTVWDRSKLYAADMDLLDKGLSFISSHAKDKYLLTLIPQHPMRRLSAPPAMTETGPRYRLSRQTRFGSLD